MSTDRVLLISLLHGAPFASVAVHCRRTGENLPARHQTCCGTYCCCCCCWQTATRRPPFRCRCAAPVRIKPETSGFVVHKRTTHSIGSKTGESAKQRNACSGVASLTRSVKFRSDERAAETDCFRAQSACAICGLLTWRMPYELHYGQRVTKRTRHWPGCS